MLRLVLLPGMDGTGVLFEGFIQALPEKIKTQIIPFPRRQLLSYLQLSRLIAASAPSVDPFILIAESYSTPLAIQFAATNPKNLRGLVICAGFATSPVKGLLRGLIRACASLLFRLRLPAFLVRRLLLDGAASKLLVRRVRSAVSSVKPQILSARLLELTSCDALPELAAVAVPILYLRAAQDRLVPARCFQEIQRTRPEIQVAVVPGPHLILQRSPQQTARIICNFIRTLE